MPFSASYDRLTRFMSAFLCLAFLVLIIATHSLALAILSLLIILVAYAYSPRGYVLEGRSIVVRRLVGQVRIALDDLREVRRVTANDLRGCLRLWGSGGLFGYYGLFSSSQLGRFTQYATNRKNSVLLITGTKRFVVSPDDVDAFLASIRASSPVLGSTPTPTLASDAPRSRAVRNDHRHCPRSRCHWHCRSRRHVFARPSQATRSHPRLSPSTIASTL